MSQKEVISRYNLIIKKLRKRAATFDEIAGYLALESEIHSYNFNISKRTFQRDLEDIRSIYNIDIQYDFSRKVYFIDSNGQQEVNERLLEAFDTFNALNISDRLSNYIHFENRRSMGTENLYGLLFAMQNKVRIQFTYKKFWEDKATQRTVEPFALKEFRNRWYLVGNDTNKDSVRIFALDRLQNLEISKSKFTQNGTFDVNEYFQDSFGIISPDGKKAEKVILSFTPDQGKYIKSLPLHHSQQIIADNHDEVSISLRLVITFDFVMELMSYGPEVKVIQPQNLAKELKENLKKALQNYN